MATISLKRLSDSTPVQIEESDILVVYGTSSDAIVEYVNSQSGRKEKVEVANSVVQIAAVSEKLFEVSLPDYPSTTVYLNSDRVMNVYEDNSVAVIIYDRAASAKTRFITDETKEAVLNRVYVKEGYLTYDVASYTSNTIVLSASDGNVTSELTAGKILTLFGSTDANNETYQIASSAYAAGQTTVTVTGGTITDTSDTDGKIMVKSSLDSAELTVGTVGTNVTAKHFSEDGKNYVTELTLTDVSFTVAGAASEAIGALVYTFPAGTHYIDATHMNVSLQGGGTVDADTPDIGIGTVIATGAVALLGGTATFEDIVDGQTAADCSGTATDAFLEPDDKLSSSGDVKLMHLNIADTWAGADTVLASGTIKFRWSIL